MPLASKTFFPLNMNTGDPEPHLFTNLRVCVSALALRAIMKATAAGAKKREENMRREGKVERTRASPARRWWDEAERTRPTFYASIVSRHSHRTCHLGCLPSSPRQPSSCSSASFRPLATVIWTSFAGHLTPALTDHVRRIHVRSSSNTVMTRNRVSHSLIPARNACTCRRLFTSP